ncbi:hypothetical protein C492_08955 [Natronococcus jeotgali DSM 18795]|uniref:Uncharacterized protein n=1 Tax=Natronococcus jeotgali DSM 18795 TaxID=1227498 RepID=L9XMR4_9EURY|nr:hypothetical protein C492_08955 [Natronococcus jeotgali DSM 18795]
MHDSVSHRFIESLIFVLFCQFTNFFFGLFPMLIERNFENRAVEMLVLFEYNTFPLQLFFQPSKCNLDVLALFRLNVQCG